MEGDQVHKDAIKIGNIIKWLSYAAMAITFVGFLWYIVVTKENIDYTQFSNHYIFDYKLFVTSLIQPNPYSTMLLGILLLLLTPLIRIILLTTSFWKHKNSLYGCIGLLIITILLLSALLGKGH